MLLLVGAQRAGGQDITYECTPAPTTCEGWYRQNVTIDWTVLPQSATVVAGCQDRRLTTDTAGRIEYCSAQLGSAKATREVTMTVDKTAPVVTGGLPTRAADFFGWYNHPVAVTFRGTDLTSGIASCTSPTYGGPDSGAGLVFGTCIDRAGNTSSAFGFGLSYDATAPPLTGVDAVPGDRRVTLRWKTSADAQSVEVTRTPGRRKARSSVVFRGPGRKFEDNAVANRKRYVYEVRLLDAAGNASERTVGVTPHAHLVSPARLTAVRRGNPPVLRWTPVRRASYYNVQLFRDGQKVLSAWPEQARFRLKKRWSYLGQRRRLVPGKYRWLVFPGFGPRSQSNYGEQLGPTSFRIRR